MSEDAIREEPEADAETETVSVAEAEVDDGSQDDEPQFGPEQAQRIRDDLRSQQNFLGGAVAGLVAALVGAGLWAAVTVATGLQIGWMSVGVGFLVGVSVRRVGRGLDAGFGIVGACLALLGCALGNLLAVCEMVAKLKGVALFEIVSRLDWPIIQALMTATFDPMDLLFYGIAVYEGYRLSFRHLSPQESRALLVAEAAPAA